MTNSDYFELAIKALGPVVALIGIFVAKPLLKKKLIENHITQRIEQIHQSNSQVRLYCQKLVSKYTPLLYKVEKLSHQDIKNLSAALEEGYIITQDCSAEVATLMYYLKNTILQFEIKFNYYNKSFPVFTVDILVFVVNCLHRIINYSTQAVPVPAKTRIKNVDLIVGQLRQFVTDGKISKFQNFKLGVNYDRDSALNLIFTDMIIRTNKPYLMESVCKVSETTRSIAKLLYLRKIYAPLKWGKTNEEFELFKREFILIGFVENTTHNLDLGDTTETINLYYANLKNISFNPRLDQQTFFKDFKDDWLNGEISNFSNPLKLSYVTEEMIEVVFERKVLLNTFTSNKRKIRANLKIRTGKVSYINKLSRIRS